MSFRAWCQEMWFEHCAELDAYGLPVPYQSGDYFRKFKYWLKREYRHQQGVK